MVYLVVHLQCLEIAEENKLGNFADGEKISCIVVWVIYIHILSRYVVGMILK